MAHDLVSTTWLQEHLSDRQVRIIDCRWVVGEPGVGRRQYDENHIPGSVYLDVDEHLSAREGPGRHPLPLKRDFQRIMSEVGISREINVVAYDGGQGMPAPRLWWLLKYYGHERVSILDGGWALWIREGRPVSQEVPSFSQADFVARPKRKWVVDKETVDSLRDDPDVLLIDARSSERFKGLTETIDPRAGHIPGAANLPYARILDPDTGLFPSPERLRVEFERMGTSQAKTIICYCGSGITACTAILALRLAGMDHQADIKLYEGSWSEWSRDSELPIAVEKK